MDAVLHALQQVQALLGSLSPMVYSIASLLVSEVVMRVWPTAKPLSWGLAADAVLKKAGEVFSDLGSVCQSLSQVIDKVVPQNVSAQPEQPKQ